MTRRALESSGRGSRHQSVSLDPAAISSLSNGGDVPANCSNRTCKKKFGILCTPARCFSCHKFFCINCLPWHIRVPQQDSDERPRICNACYAESNSEVFGQSRSMTAGFHAFRNAKKGYKCSDVNHAKECIRIIEEFKNYRKRSPLARISKSFVAVLKENCKPNLTGKCSFCGNDPSKLVGLKFCAVCNVSLCGTCSIQKLLVYQNESEEFELSIIEIIGCPDAEPSVSECLRTCQQCYEVLKKRQVDKVHSDKSTTEDELFQIYEKIQLCQKKVDDAFNKYVSVLDMLGVRHPSSAPSTSSTSSTQKLKQQSVSLQGNKIHTLARSHTSLADLISDFSQKVGELKRLKLTSEKQQSLCKRICQSKNEHYFECKCLFSLLRDSLKSTISEESLKLIQEEVTFDALNCCYILLQQLGLETLLISSVRGFPHVLPGTISNIVQCVEDVLALEVKKRKGEWEAHKHDVDVLIRDRLDRNKQLVEIPPAITARGDNIAWQFLLLRCDDVVSRIFEQLDMKSSTTGCTVIKKNLKDARGKIAEIAKDYEIFRPPNGKSSKK